MKIRNESINKNYLIPSVITTLGIATVFGAGMYSATNITNTSNVSALSYSTSNDISFTFAPTLSIGLSTDSLTIDNLVPGTTSDSNKVSVTVSSNTPYGYVLSAGVGSTVSTDPYYNTSDLVHDNTTTEVPTNNKFSSIATTANLQTLDTDNTWGYSTSTDGGTSWSTYSGLSHAATKPLLDISDPATPSTIDFKIAARSATTQASGTYNNVITFYAVGKPEPPTLYEEVQKQSKGKQTADDLREEITKVNSGVYEYDDTIFGESSDASNANKIYYYRGILDNSFDPSDPWGEGGIGSSGDGTLYPNYVILSSGSNKTNTDTCWRIVRTTGSGGVKMIYNGTWTGSTCANIGDAAQIGKSPFSGVYGTEMQVVRVGYTYNEAYAQNFSTVRTLADLFGTNSSDYNTTNSSVKTVIDEWYNSNLSAYTGLLESSAGFCGDRTVYRYGQLQPESLRMPQYTSGMDGTYGFGSYHHNAYSSQQSPTLTCAKSSSGNILMDRSTVDLYSVVGSSTGNGRLLYPIALLTADEASFSGLGAGSQYGSAYSSNSFLRSGPFFWLLSPRGLNRFGERNSTAFVFLVKGSRIPTESYLENVRYSEGVRPAISLVPGIGYTSGSGTATDPWVVPAP